MGGKCPKNTITLYEIIEITADTSQIGLYELILSISNPFKFLSNNHLGLNLVIDHCSLQTRLILCSNFIRRLIFSDEIYKELLSGKIKIYMINVYKYLCLI